MTYYQQTIQQLQRALYPHQELTEKIIRTKQYIHRHYAENINLDLLSREAWLSKFHFIRLFRRYYGLTPYAYLKEVRLTRAKELLRSGLPVKDVCHAVGFDSIPSFTRLYKAATGITPKRAISDKRSSG
jgi:AraC-like DNA-binding protein